MQRNREGGGNRMGKTRDRFKKTRDIKVIFHARMGTIKDRNGKDLSGECMFFSFCLVTTKIWSDGH